MAQGEDSQQLSRPGHKDVSTGAGCAQEGSLEALGTSLSLEDQVEAAGAAVGLRLKGGHGARG